MRSEWSGMGDDEERSKDTSGLMEARETPWWKCASSAAPPAHPRRKCAEVNEQMSAGAHLGSGRMNDLLFSLPDEYCAAPS